MHPPKSISNILEEHGEGFYFRPITNEALFKIVEALFFWSNNIENKYTVQKEEVFIFIDIINSIRVTLEKTTSVILEKTSTQDLPKDLLLSTKQIPLIRLWENLLKSLLMDIMQGLITSQVFLTVASYKAAYNMDLRLPFLVPIYTKQLSESFSQTPEQSAFFQDEINICIFLMDLKPSQASLAIKTLKNISESHENQELREAARKSYDILRKKEETA